MERGTKYLLSSSMRALPVPSLARNDRGLLASIFSGSFVSTRPLKVFTSIVALAAAGQTIGITACSHKVIDNLLTNVRIHTPAGTPARCGRAPGSRAAGGRCSHHSAG